MDEKSESYPGLTVIKLSSSSFIPVHKNHPIRRLDILDTVYQYLVVCFWSACTKIALANFTTARPDITA